MMPITIYSRILESNDDHEKYDYELKGLGSNITIIRTMALMICKHITLIFAILISIGNFLLIRFINS